MSGRISQLWLTDEARRKPCNKCGVIKDLQDFPATNRKHRDGTQGICKICKAEWMRKDRISNPNRYKNHDLKQYGINLEFYKYLLDKQGGVCAICGKSERYKNKNLHVDHCHETNRVRGLLCSDCNTGLGKFFDNERFLLKASRYITENRR